MNTQKNPICTPTPNGTGAANEEINLQRNMSQQEPFQMSECASNIPPGSDKGSAQVLLSSHLGSSYKS